MIDKNKIKNISIKKRYEKTANTKTRAINCLQ